MSLRPEKIEISKKPVQGFSNELIGTVKSIVYHGRSTQYNVRLKNDLIVQVFEQNEEHFPQEVIDYDDQVYSYFEECCLYCCEPQKDLVESLTLYHNNLRLHHIYLGHAVYC